MSLPFFAAALTQVIKLSHCRKSIHSFHFFHKTDQSQLVCLVYYFDQSRFDCKTSSKYICCWSYLILVSQMRELCTQPPILRRRNNHIPYYIALNILAKLSVKSVIRFRCVYESWDFSTKIVIMVMSYTSRLHLLLLTI